MPVTNPSPIPTSGGVNLSADAATAATTIAANVSLGPAGENTPRPPLTDWGMTGLGASPVIGIYVWLDWLIMVTADRKVWAAAIGAPTVAIALSNTTAATQLPGVLRPVFTQDSLRVIISGGGAPLAWTGAGLCSVLVTVGTPPAATHVASLGQRIIANDLPNMNVWSWSWLGDGVHDHWGAEPATSNNEVAEANPDGVIAILASSSEAYVFGQKTVQVYSGATPDVIVGVVFPFSAVVTLDIGCAAPYTPIVVDGPLMWLDDKRRIVTSDGRQFKDSSEDISVVLRQMTTVIDAWSYREDIGNQTNIVFQFPTEGQELVYDLGKKAWLQRSLYTPNGQTVMPYRCKAYWPALNAHVFGSSTAGAIYRWTEGAGQDLGLPVVMERQTGWIEHGTRNRKRSVRIRSVFRRGTGGTGVPDSFEVRVADDGGPWSQWEQVSVGATGDTEQTEDIYMGGIFRRRRYHFRYTGSNSTAWISSEEQWQECAS